MKMTLTEALTGSPKIDQQLNRIGAELAGIVPHPTYAYVFIKKGMAETDWLGCCPDLLNAPTSLYRVAQIEAGLTDEKFEVYRWELWHICKDSSVKKWYRNHLSASPRQRLVALILTLKPGVIC